MADDPKLVVAITARLDQFEKSMREAGLIAEREVKKIETKLSTVTLGAAGGILAAKAITAGIDEVKRQIEQVVDQMLALGAATKKTAVDLTELQRIGFATRVSGISDKEMFSGLEAAANKMNEMNHHTTRLSQLLDANNIKYRDQAGQVVKIDQGLELAAELMSRAKTEADKIEIARIFGLTQQWVAVLGQGAEHFRQIKGEAPVKELEAVVAHMKALEALANQIKAHFSGWGSELIVHVLPVLEKVTGVISAIATGLSQKTIGGPLEGFVTDLANKWAIVHGEVQSTIASLNRTKITVPGGGSGVNFPERGGFGGRKGDLQKFDEQLSKHNELLKAELETIGLSVAEQEKARQVALLTEAAKREGLTLEQALTEERQKQIGQSGALKQEAIERADALQKMVSASKEFGSELSSAFKGLVLEGKKLDEVVKSLTNRMASKAIDKLFDMMFASAAGSSTTPFLDLLKGLQGRAAGGPVSAGTPYMVGERGAELFVPSRSGMILPASASRGGGAGAVTYAPVTTVDARGSQMSEAQFKLILAENNRTMLKVVTQAAPARQRRLQMLGT